MAFDADAWIRAEEPPTFIVGGATYVGQQFSVLEGERLLQKLIKAGSNDLTDVAALKLMREVVETLFPPAKRRWWQRRSLSTVDLFFAMPLAAQLAAIQTFSRSLARQMLPSPGKNVATDATAATGENREREHPSAFRWPPFFQPTLLPSEDGQTLATA